MNECSPIVHREEITYRHFKIGRRLVTQLAPVVTTDQVKWPLTGG